MGQAYGATHKAVWRNFGGTAHASFGTNVSDFTLFNNKSTYNNKVIPYRLSKTMASEIDVTEYEYWANRENVLWTKHIRAYTSSGPYTSDNRLHADVHLKFTGGATMQKVMDSLNQGYVDLGGYVYMTMYIGTERTFYDYGRTKYAYSSGSTSIGFANNTDSSVPAGEDVMGNGISLFSSPGWEARHVISYIHNSSGRDTTRCQFNCWGDISGVVEEVVFHARKSI